MASSEATTSDAGALVHLPRVTIKYCTQCKWMLRAAYFAQELLSTFSTSLGEVALIAATGGVFTVDIVHAASSSGQILTSNHSELRTTTSRLWDRKSEGGFPEVKHLKQLVRNVIDPGRDLGHVDRDHGNVRPKRGDIPAVEGTAKAQESSTEGGEGRGVGARNAVLDSGIVGVTGNRVTKESKKETEQAGKAEGAVCEDCA